MAEAQPIFCSICRDIHIEGKHLTLEQVEKRHIVHVYEQTGHNISHTKRILQIARSTLHMKLDQYGLRH